MTARLLARLGLALAVLALTAGVAVARPRVAIVGDDAAVVAALARALADQVEQVDEHADGVAAIVRVTVTPTGRAARKAKKLTATVIVVQGEDGAEVGTLVVRERKAKLAAATARVAWKKLGKAIGGARARAVVTAPVAAAPPSPAPVAAAPARAPATATAPDVAANGELHAVAAAGRRAPRITIALDERPFVRRLRWNDDLDQVLRRYDLAANAIGVTVAARPLRAVPGVVVALAGELAVGVNGSRTEEGMEFATTSSEWSAALGWGRRVAGLEVGVAVAYGEHRFAIDGDQGMGGELVPDVTYRWARGGLDLRRPLARRWTLTARGGYRHLLGTGDLGGAAWFPRATGRGVDGAVGLQLHVARWLDAYARAEARHYFFAMHPEVGDALVAGGAVDTYVGGALGLAVALR